MAFSFTDWSAYTDELNFVGWENFKTIFSPEENYVKVISNTLVFTFVTTIIKNVFGLLLALLLTKHMRLLNFHRGVMFMPSVLSTLIVGMVFTSILNPAEGLLTLPCGASGLTLWPCRGSPAPSTLFGTVMAVDIWKGTGYIMTVLIAGLMSISPTYL